MAAAAFAQEQASHWFFASGGYLNYEQLPVTVVRRPLLEAVQYGMRFSSISDSTGALLYYTNGNSFINNRHELMLNSDIKGVFQSRKLTVTIPKPGCKNLFYTFTTTRNNQQSVNHLYDRWAIEYAVVDVAAEGGKGKVLVKNKRLVDICNETLAVFEGADGESFWLVTTGKMHEIYAYKISKEGILQCPVITRTNLPFAVGNLKASPDSKHMVVALEQGLAYETHILSFNNISGRFTSQFVLRNNADRHFLNKYEFSPDSKNLFVVEGWTSNSEPRVYYSKLLRYDVSIADRDLFEKSQMLVYERSSYYGWNYDIMQLGPDGRILYAENTHDYLLSINTPNTVGNFNFNNKSVGYNADLHNTNWGADYWNLPFFPAFFFKPGGYKASAYNSAWRITVCAGSPVQIRNPFFNPTYTYEWKNEATSEVFYGLNPVLSLPVNLEKGDTTYYSVKKTSPGGCFTTDVIEVITLPSSNPEVLGSKTVCPEAREVAYRVAHINSESEYEWFIEGGNIVQGQGTGSITVNWGPVNNRAAVSLHTTFRNGCKRTFRLPVHVTQNLAAGKPVGQDTLNCSTNVYQYKVSPTSGSYYHWQVLNGTIVEGQGSAHVTVAWHKEAANGYLWINETAQVACMGSSDTLVVHNPLAKAYHELQIGAVTAILHKPSMFRLQYKVVYPHFIKNTLTVLARPSGESNGAWKNVASVPKHINVIEFSVPGSDKTSFDFKLQAETTCGEKIESDLHRSVFVSARIDEAKEQVNLTWNHYLGWENGVYKYEVYRKTENEDRYQLLQTVYDSKGFTLTNIADGFSHCFYIKAFYSGGKEIYTTSNEACILYQHRLKFTNVFTPNGDGINDYFVIDKIHLFPDNELTVYDRHGKVVYKTTGYNNDWNAHHLPEGLYYFYFYIQSSHKQYRSWVQVLR